MIEDRDEHDKKTLALARYLRSMVYLLKEEEEVFFSTNNNDRYITDKFKLEKRLIGASLYLILKLLEVIDENSQYIPTQLADFIINNKIQSTIPDFFDENFSGRNFHPEDEFVALQHSPKWKAYLFDIAYEFFSYQKANCQNNLTLRWEQWEGILNLLKEWDYSLPINRAELLLFINEYKVRAEILGISDEEILKKVTEVMMGYFQDLVEITRDITDIFVLDSLENVYHIYHTIYQLLYILLEDMNI